jgi:hypothetical protein
LGWLYKLEEQSLRQRKWNKVRSNWKLEECVENPLGIHDNTLRTSWEHIEKNKIQQPILPQKKKKPGTPWVPGALNSLAFFFA